jgi:hypothetical protein
MSASLPVVSSLNAGVHLPSTIGAAHHLPPQADTLFALPPPQSHLLQYNSKETTLGLQLNTYYYLAE